MDIKQKRAKSLYSLRVRKLLSKDELAELAGVSPTTMRDVEDGKVGMQMKTAKKIADALGVHPLAIYDPDEFAKWRKEAKSARGM